MEAVWEVGPNPGDLDIGAFAEVDLGEHGVGCAEAVDLVYKVKCFCKLIISTFCWSIYDKLDIVWPAVKLHMN